MKTPVRQLFDELWETPKDKFVWHAILKEALEKEKEIICQVYIDGFTLDYDKEGFDPHNDIGYRAWSEYYFNDKFI